MKKKIISLIISFFILVSISFITPFCNLYADYVYPVINGIIGSITGIFPFALGEILMYIGAVSVLIIPLLLIILIFAHKKVAYRHFVKMYCCTLFIIALIVLNIYCINWLIPFRCQVLKVSDNTRTEFSDEEVIAVRSMIVQNINELVWELERDSDGHLVADYTQDDVINAMRLSSDEFTRLKGHYSHYKTAICSNFLEWMGIGGYNYPYTMEPTLNRYCSNMYTPVLYAHELSHHKGYYKENEANFLSYVTLAKHGNPYLQYCAYIEMYFWLDDAVYRDILSYYDNCDELYLSLPQLDTKVWEDYIYDMYQRRTFYEENINQDLEDKFKEVSSEVSDTGWDLQDQILKDNTYSGVTLMLLRYYLE